MENTFLYLVDFKYVGDTSSHSANIPDVVAFQCIVESEKDLTEVPIYEIKEDYRIKEFLEQNDCETISLYAITREEYHELITDLEYIYW